MKIKDGILPELLLLLFFTVINSPVFSQNTYKNITAIQSDSLITANAANPNFVILDVRRASEWSSDHLHGAINRDYYQGTFRQELDQFPKHKTFLIHCQSGGRSAKAFSIMQELGFSEVYNMKGGISSWKSNSFPVTKDTSPLLMLVSSESSRGNYSDTMRITLTNRANDLLVFHSVTLEDTHAITHNFDNETRLEGAEDYTFSIYHSPGYEPEDSTLIALKSNGGDLVFKVKADKNITNIATVDQNNLFEIYPNPTSDKLFFKGIKENSIPEIWIYELSGKRVLHKMDHPTHKELSLLNLNEGIHVVVLKLGVSVKSKKIIVRH